MIKRINIAGIDAITHLTINLTIDQKGILKLVMTTSVLLLQEEQINYPMNLSLRQ